ncbi:MAG: phage baseplate protein, partial [Fusobacteriaceae bacterium]
NANETVMLTYNSGLFKFKYFTVPKSNAVDSDSTTTVGTSYAVKKAYDKGLEAVAGNNNLESKKLDRGGYTGTAMDFVKKAGDTVDGKLIVGSSLIVKDKIRINSNTFQPEELEPTISFAIGDTDTGFDWVSDGDIAFYANGVKAYSMSEVWRSNNFNPNNKTDKGGYNGTAKDLYDKCPYNVGDVFTTTNNSNPAASWIGTTWSKIEGRYLKGSTGSEASKLTGGANSKVITTANLPAHNHTASGSSNSIAAHSHNAKHNHVGSVGSHTHTAYHNHSATQTAHNHAQPKHNHQALNSSGSYQALSSARGFEGGNSSDGRYLNSAAGGVFISSNGDETTGNATPVVTVDKNNVVTGASTPSLTVGEKDFNTEANGAHSHTITVTTGNTGSGSAFDVQPSYYTVHYWLRTA